MGQIFVSTELLNVTETDSQLAVVLGHEISHALLSHGVCEPQCLVVVLQRFLSTAEVLTCQIGLIGG